MTTRQTTQPTSGTPEHFQQFWSGAGQLDKEHRWGRWLVAAGVLVVVIAVAVTTFAMLGSSPVPTQPSAKLPAAIEASPTTAPGSATPIQPAKTANISFANCKAPAPSPVVILHTNVLWKLGDNLAPSSTDAIEDFNPTTTPGRRLATYTWVISPYVTVASFRYSVWVSNDGCEIFNVTPHPHTAVWYGTTDTHVTATKNAVSLNLSFKPGTFAWTQFTLVPASVSSR